MKKEYIYTVYSKSENDSESKIKILNKAFKIEKDAYIYALSKIKTIINVIKNDIYEKKGSKIMPTVFTSMVDTLFIMKEGNYIDQYDHFLKNYKKFFNELNMEPIMFFISCHELI